MKRMKKIIFITGFSFFINNCFAQQALEQVAKSYYRCDPFKQETGSFLKQLINDPTLINITIFRRTDTSLFYFKGEYKNFNPFFFKPDRTVVILSEKELLLNDSLNLADTIFTYQIAGYIGEGKNTVHDVKQEFKKFDHKYLKKFSSSEFSELRSGDLVYGAIRNYYVAFTNLSPLTAAWQEIGSTHESVFVITLRFKMYDNVAVLPITTDGF